MTRHEREHHLEGRLFEPLAAFVYERLGALIIQIYELVRSVVNLVAERLAEARRRVVSRVAHPVAFSDASRVYPVQRLPGVEGLWRGLVTKLELLYSTGKQARALGGRRGACASLVCAR